MTTRTVALLTAIALSGVLCIEEARAGARGEEARAGGARAGEARAANSLQDEARAANSLQDEARAANSLQDEARAANSLQDEVRAANSLQEKKGGPKAAPSVAGRWTMFVKGGPHGDMTMSVELAQEGKRVSGTFATPHGNLPVEGEFIEATLTIATSAGGDTPISLTAKLKEGGTLEGYLSSQMGDMTWTASRASDK